MSKEDIFELREINEKKFQIEENRRKAIEFDKNWKFKPYQRKQFVSRKIFKPDEEMIQYLSMLELEPSELEKLI